MKLKNLDKFKIFLRYTVGCNSWLYALLYGVDSTHRSLLTNRQTQIVIEGFPRSANTFSVVLFLQANPELPIAHHLHLSAQIIKAVQLKVPAVVLIRNPKDAIASLLIYKSSLSVEVVFKYYIEFYKSLLPYKVGYIVATFEDVTQDFDSVVAKINRRFGTDFASCNSPEAGNNVLRQIEEWSSSNPFKSPCPKPERSRLKEDFMQKICHPKNKHLLQEAEAVYEEFLRLAQ